MCYLFSQKPYKVLFPFSNCDGFPKAIQIVVVGGGLCTIASGK